jgi:anti-sigma-K factor RskA
MSPDVHTLTGAYVLDALNPDESAEFERHVAECPDCARETDELRATAARLGSAATLRPPTRLRDSILAEVARTRQDPPSGLRVVGSATGSGKRRRWVVWSTSLAAAFALLAAGVLAGVAVNTDSALQSAQSQLNQAQTQYAPVAQLLAAPDVRTSVDSANGASATVLTSKSLGRSVLITHDLPAQPSDRTYQAWGITGTDVRSLGLLGTGGSATLATQLGNATTIGITVEPRGGSPTPTSTPIMIFPSPV